MTRKYFGTDGIRGRVGEHPINAEFMLKLGWATGRVLGTRPEARVVIGKDTRISGYMFEAALEAGLAAAGVGIRMLGPMPTPGIAYLTWTLHASAGIVISASHNSHEDNGIKFFSASGGKLPETVEEQIERELEKPMVTVDSSRLGKAERLDDARGLPLEAGVLSAGTRPAARPAARAGAPAGLPEGPGVRLPGGAGHGADAVAAMARPATVPLERQPQTGVLLLPDRHRADPAAVPVPSEVLRQGHHAGRG